MCKLIVHNKRWWISKNGKTVLSGVGTPSEAIAIAEANEYVLTEFEDLKSKVAA